MLGFSACITTDSLVRLLFCDVAMARPCRTQGSGAFARRMQTALTVAITCSVARAGTLPGDARLPRCAAFSSLDWPRPVHIILNHAGRVRAAGLVCGVLDARRPR